METRLKEKLFLFSINPERGNIRQRNNFSTLLFYSSLFELTRLGLLRIEDGRWNMTEQDTGDPVLNEVLRIILPKNGQKTQWVLSTIPFRITRLFTIQLEWMRSQNLIQVRDVKFLGMRLGYRFRISKPDQLKPDLLQLERSLIYGRQPAPQTHLLILMLGVAGLHKNLFRSSEMSKRADVRYKQLRKTNFENDPETYSEIFKKLREALKAK